MTNIEMQGLDTLIGKLKAAQNTLPTIMRVATLEAMALVLAQAKINLQSRVYERERKPFAREFSENLANAWIMDIEQIGNAVLGKVRNTDEAAIFMETGTIEHDVEARNAPRLVWVDEETGKSMADEIVHVAGIEATHFLEDAARDSMAAIILIYARHLRIMFGSL